MSIEDPYYHKYLKYKNKYLALQEIVGGKKKKKPSKKKSSTKKKVSFKKLGSFVKSNPLAQQAKELAMKTAKLSAISALDTAIDVVFEEILFEDVKRNSESFIKHEKIQIVIPIINSLGLPINDVEEVFTVSIDIATDKDHLKMVIKEKIGLI